MSATITRLVKAPTSLQWWEWMKLAGALAMMLLLATLVNGVVSSPFVVAVVLHVALDFSLQSDEVAMRKGERGKHLLLHALAAGGLPTAVAGLFVGPAAVLTGTAIGVISHYAVDWTRKFGLRQEALAGLLDQACNLLAILVLTLAD